MTYSIEFVESARKEFKSLTREEQVRVVAVLERLHVNPASFAMKLSGSKACRVRVGKLRVILDILEEAQMITVLKIGNRENTYSP